MSISYCLLFIRSGLISWSGQYRKGATKTKNFNAQVSLNILAMAGQNHEITLYISAFLIIYGISDPLLLFVSRNKVADKAHDSQYLLKQVYRISGHNSTW